MVRLHLVTVDGEEGATNFGFMAKLVMLDLSASSVLTRERTEADASQRDWGAQGRQAQLYY
jgi:hypothetical protein